MGLSAVTGHRLLLTGDLLRPQDEAFRPAQTDNIRWLHRLLRRPITRATGLEVEALAWGPPPASGVRVFDTPGLYAAAGASRDIEGWASLFAARSLPRDATERLAEPFLGVSAVIGFELAEVQKLLLGRMGIPWIDVSIHPYRFGPDLLFAFQTNHDGVLEALTAHHTEDVAFEPWADLLAAMSVKVHLHPPVEERVLVIGQTRIDRALIQDGRLRDLRDLAGPFHQAIGREERILFRPHPYNPEAFGLHETGLPLRRVRETLDNAYLLLAQDALKRVVAVSSSLVAEARFFGKEGIFLGTPPVRVASTRDRLARGLHASILDAWLSADFWRDLLAPLLPVTAKDGQRPTLPPNTLRSTLRQFWGWEELAFQLPVELAVTRMQDRARSGPAPR